VNDGLWANSGIFGEVFVGKKEGEGEEHGDVFVGKNEGEKEGEGKDEREGERVVEVVGVGGVREDVTKSNVVEEWETLHENQGNSASNQMSYSMMSMPSPSFSSSHFHSPSPSLSPSPQSSSSLFPSPSPSLSPQSSSSLIPSPSPSSSSDFFESFFSSQKEFHYENGPILEFTKKYQLQIHQNSKNINVIKIYGFYLTDLVVVRNSQILEIEKQFIFSFDEKKTKENNFQKWVCNSCLFVNDVKLTNCENSECKEPKSHKLPPSGEMVHKIAICKYEIPGKSINSQKNNSQKKIGKAFLFGVHPELSPKQPEILMAAVLWVGGFLSE
jgi:hypothetical protein